MQAGRSTRKARQPTAGGPFLQTEVGLHLKSEVGLQKHLRKRVCRSTCGNARPGVVFQRQPGFGLQKGTLRQTDATIPTKSSLKVSEPWRRSFRIVGTVASVAKECQNRGARAVPDGGSAGKEPIKEAPPLQVGPQAPASGRPAGRRAGRDPTPADPAGQRPQRATPRRRWTTKPRRAGIPQVGAAGAGPYGGSARGRQRDG